MNIDSFIESLAVQTSSKETLRAYRQDITRYANFLEEKGLADTEAKQSTILEFLRHIEAGKGRTVAGSLAPATVARRLSVVAEYYKFLQGDSDVAVRNPVHGVRRPKIRNEKPRDVNDGTLETLIDGITDVRDRAIVLLFLYSGLRLSELGQLDKTTMTLKKTTLPDGSSQYFGSGEVVGKGGKRRAFLAGPKAMQAVATYISQRRLGDELPALFLSTRKTRLSSRAIQQVVNKWCARLGVSHIHVHQFRHSFASRNVNAGMSAVVLQSLLGHSNLNTTQRYFHMKPERLSREYFSAMEFVRQHSPV